jgi:hypothetical protein
LTLAQNLIQNASLKEIKSVAPAQRLQYLQDLLGVYKWSIRTADALNVSKSEPERMVLLAINSPEYVVGA